MGDRKNKTMQEKPILLDLEDLYQGIPDESVNLTFQDLADVNASSSEKSKPTTTMTTLEPVSQVSNNNNPTRTTSSSLAKLPSLDFSKGLQASIQHHHHQEYHFGHEGSNGVDSPWSWGHSGHRLEGNNIQGQLHDSHQLGHASGGAKSPRCNDHLGYSVSHDDMSVASGRGGGGGGRRRPGIPHSKICTICSNYVYVFRTRCLVCGRVYCWKCVQVGMGEMIEGRKCIECLGLRFSQRYIERAGKVGCCRWRYPSTMKQVELMCAEKGPRKSGRSYGHSGMATSTTPRSPISTPRSAHAIGSNEHSFVLSSSFSTFSPHHHNLPL